MIRHFVAILAYVFMLLTPCCTWGIGLPTAKITVIVIDEKGELIEGAKVGIGFERNTGSGTTEIPVIGSTATNGQFSGSASAMDYVGFRVEKDGYYQSFGNYKFKEHKLGKWQPWNPEIKLMMRKIEKPVSMYARNLHMSHPEVEIPVVGKEVGFDLFVGDWVEPYGKGLQADFVIKLNRRVTGEYDYEGKLEVTFKKKFDGIQVYKDDRKGGSVFKLPRFAPENGYENKLLHSIECKDIGTLTSDFKDDNNYFFRVRSEEKDGKLERAVYGKIQGDIKFYLTKKSASIEFKYFLNPDHTRNLEYSGKNLFPGVQVGID